MAKAGISVNITPHFNANQIMFNFNKFYWAQLQLRMVQMSQAVASKMQQKVAIETKRGGTGKLASHLTAEILNTTAGIDWGIGHIATLNSEVKYWYVLNYGKKVSGEPFRPGGGKWKPYQFEDGKANPNLKGTGVGGSKAVGFTNRSNTKTSIINSFNYIEAGQKELNKQIKLLMAEARSMGAI